MMCFSLLRPAAGIGEIKMKFPPLVSVQAIRFIGTDGRFYTLNPSQDFIVDDDSTGKGSSIK